MRRMAPRRSALWPGAAAAPGSAARCCSSGDRCGPPHPLACRTSCAGLMAAVCRALTSTRVHVLIRPRPGDFLYSDQELQARAGLFTGKPGGGGRVLHFAAACACACPSAHSLLRSLRMHPRRTLSPPSVIPASGHACRRAARRQLWGARRCARDAGRGGAGGDRPAAPLCRALLSARLVCRVRVESYFLGRRIAKHRPCRCSISVSLPPHLPSSPLPCCCRRPTPLAHPLPALDFTFHRAAATAPSPASPAPSCAAPGLDLTFHRAFDLARDQRKALDDLVACRVRRVLSSGEPRCTLHFLFPCSKHAVLW